MTQRNIDYSAPVTRNTTPKREVAQLSLNHPKNYFGVPLAVAADADTGHVINSHLVSMCGRARDGAEALGLIDCDANLTALGEEIVGRCATQSSIERDIETLGGLKGSSARFIDAAPAHWESLTQQIVANYDPATQLVDVLEKTGPVTLPELTALLVRHDHDLVSTFLRNPDDVTTPDSDTVLAASFSNPELYAGQAVYQFKTFLYHAGVLTSRGADTSALVPDQDIWALENPTTMYSGGEE